MKPMFKVKTTGNFDKDDTFFKKMKKRYYLRVMEKYAEIGLDALKEATPVDTGKTRDAWKYEITERDEGIITLSYINNNSTDTGASIVLLLMFGHGTKDGTYVEGNDFVYPTIKPIFNEMASKIWREVKR